MLSKKFLNMLCCPKRFCREDLEEMNNNGRDVLKCVNCGAEYPIKENIPILFPNALYSSNVHQRYWDSDVKAESYAKKYDGYLKKQGTPWGMYTHISELKAIKRLVKSVGLNLTGGTIIDCGCGNGRLLDDYPEMLNKIGIDASLRLLQETKKRNPNYWLVCGQLEDMPFKDCVADFSVSIRVFQHLEAPEHAFSEMVRITRPSGYMALEVYNKLNLKELYKKFRMFKLINKRWPWGLDYDRYYSYREIKKWCQANFIKPLKYAGAGWGIHFYFFDLIKFRKFAPNWLQKITFSFFLFLEDVVGALPFFSKTLEKICFIGSLQAPLPQKKLFNKAINYIFTQNDIKKAKKFQDYLTNRNYCFTGNDKSHLTLTVNWLKRAQDVTPDSGVSRGFSLVRSGKSNQNGWQPSYPETTGYIIPTMIEAGKILNDSDLFRRAKLMADWEIEIMLPDGGVHGGNICEQPSPAVFDTGQVIRGLYAVYKETNNEKYLKAAIKSASWILKNEYQKEGRWIDNNAKCVDRGATIYNIYAISPIVELGRDLNIAEFKDLGRRVSEFTLKMQNEVGWFNNCDFQNRNDALLHTIAYAIDGLWDMGILSNEDKYLARSKLVLEKIIHKMGERGFISGRLNEKWEGTVDWACLTGIAQVAVTCMKLYYKEGENKYLSAAIKAKEFIKSCQNNLDDTKGGLGAIWGSWPISGDYGKYQALNWAAKYFADLLILFVKK